MGEKVSFAHGLDSIVEKQNNKRVGDLMFVYTDIHTNTTFGVDTGDFEIYSPETDKLLRSLFTEPENY